MSEFDDAFQTEEYKRVLRALFGKPQEAIGFELHPVNSQQGSGMQLYGLVYPDFQGRLS